MDIQIDASDGFHGTVVLAQTARANGHAIRCMHLRRLGQRRGAGAVANSSK
jgi:hypothetical protein